MASALSCSPTERSTEEETIARAVSGSLCVCVCVHAQPTDLRNTVYKGRDHLLIKDGEYQKEIHARNTVESTGQYSGVLTERSTFLPQFCPLGKSRALLFFSFLGRGLCSFLFPDRERSTEEETPIARAVSGSLWV